MVLPRREYNIVVLGAGGVGKSCLTAQFVQNVWIESYDPTIEDSYRKVVEVDGISCILEMYEGLAVLMSHAVCSENSAKEYPSLDTAGTEQFTSMREIYMKSGQGFLLVYSITSLNSLQELSDLRDQILRIKEVDSVPLVLVGNKCDLEDDRTVSRNRAMHVSRKWGGAPFFETSARRRQNVDEVFITLCRQMMLEKTRPGTQGEMSVRAPSRRRERRLCVIL